MGRIEKLPNWVLTNKYPAFYDSESATAQEQIARVYGKMQELIEDYEKFSNEVSTLLAEFNVSNNEEYETFKTTLIDVIHEYIHSVDTKVTTATNYMKTNLTKTINEEIKKMRDKGELDELINELVDGVEDRVTTLEKTSYKLVHDAVTENLTLVKEVSE